MSRGKDKGDDLQLLEKRLQEAQRLLTQSEIKIEELQAALEAAAANLKLVKPAPAEPSKLP